jgi:hypothetical protein
MVIETTIVVLTSAFAWYISRKVRAAQQANSESAEARWHARHPQYASLPGPAAAEAFLSECLAEGSRLPAADAAVLHRLRGEAQLLLGAPALAQADAESALRLRSDYPAADALRAKAAYAQGNRALAVEAMAQAVRRSLADSPHRVAYTERLASWRSETAS